MCVCQCVSVYLCVSSCVCRCVCVCGKAKSTFYLRLVLFLSQTMQKLQRHHKSNGKSNPFSRVFHSPLSPIPCHQHNLLPQYKCHEKKVNFKKLFQSNLAICCCLLLLTPIRCHCFYGKARQRERETQRERKTKWTTRIWGGNTHRHTYI